jgi:hypothetical protein
VGEFEMAYIVQGVDYEGKPISTTVDDRKRALAVAITWRSQGRSGVTINGDGRIYSAKELARSIIEKE